MKNLLKIFVLSVWLLSGCTSNNAPENNVYELKETKGGKYYGGVFNLNESEYIKNLNPISIIDVYSYRVASQVYEGLFKFNQIDITHVETSLIDSYMVSDDQTKYTFHLKKGVFFHDDPCFEGGKGRELTAQDVLYCFKRICTYDKSNQSFNLFSGIVKGADEHYNISKKGDVDNHEIEGVKLIDDFTIEIELIKPNSVFLFNLARPGAFIYPKEAVDKYGEEMRSKCVGTGPFKIAAIEEDISVLLKKNENYHETDEHGNKLPYLAAININFLKDKKIELMEFKQGNLDMMYRLPTDHIIEILDDAASSEDGEVPQFELQREAEMSSQFLVFNNFKGIFSNKEVRKAFSFAIDREKILDYVLNGEGYDIGKYGFTPPSFRNYDVTQIKGFNFNLDSARYYLKKAGYPEGKGFPEITLDLNAEGERYTNVATEVQKQLKDHLNVSININIAPIAQITEKSLSGDYDLMRLAWVADYPSPENFLWFFYGKNVPAKKDEKSYPNFTRYNNETFDAYYEKAINSLSEEEANKNFMLAEKLLMKDAPVLMLWYDEGYRLLQSYVKNFPNNPMQYRDFTKVYKVPVKKESEKGS